MQHLTTLAVLAFAAYRATQLIVFDSIGDPARLRLALWHAAKPDSRARTFITELLGCTYCTGFHASWITVVTYLTATNQWGAASIWVHAIEIWAVAGAQALLNKLDS